MKKESIAILIQRLLVEEYGLMNTQTVHDDGYTVVTAEAPDKKHVRVVVQVFDKA